MRALNILAAIVASVMLTPAHAGAKTLEQETVPEVVRESAETEAFRQTKADVDLERFNQEHAQRWRTSRREVGEKHPETLDLMSQYLGTLMALDRLAEANGLSEQLVRFRREMPKSDDKLLARAVWDRAIILDRLERTGEAQILVEETWRLRQEIWGEAHYLTLDALANNGNLLLLLGRTNDAEVMRAEHLRLSRQAYGENSKVTAESMGNYATTLNAMGRWSEAESTYKKAWRVADAAWGTDHPVTLKNLSNYALFLSKIGRPLEAEKHMSYVLERMRQKWGENHQAKIDALGNYASIVSDLGRFEEAEALNAEAVKLAGELLGKSDRATLTSLNNQAAFLNSLGRAEEAETILAEVLSIRQELLGQQHPEAINTMDGYANILSNLGRLTEATAIQSKALRLSRKILGEKHPDTIRILYNYAAIIGKDGRLREAEPLHAEALRLALAAFGPQHPRVRYLELKLSGVRLKLPDSSYLAIDPARSAMSSLQNFRDAVGFNPSEEAQFERGGRDNTDYYNMFANAAWAAGPGITPEALAIGAKPLNSDLNEEVFRALQRVFDGSASQAVALAAARKMAENKDKELGELAVRRELLSDQWIAADKALLASQQETGPNSDAKRSNLGTAKAAIVTEMEQIDDRLRKDAPAYFNFVRPQPLNVIEAKALVGNEDAALMVVPTAFGTHIMVVSHEGLAWHRSDWTDKEINRAVQRLLWDVGANVKVEAADAARWGDEGDGPYPFDRDTAFALYSQIIKPVEEALKNKRHLYVVASGSLSSMPSGILVSKPPLGFDGDPAALRATRWFADEHALVQAPSLQSLQLLRQARKRSGHQKGVIEFQGFGDPILDGKTIERAQRSGSQNSRAASTIIDLNDIRKLPRLPGTAREVTALGKAFDAGPTSIFLGERATEQNVRTIDLSNTRILALATHGLIAGEISGADEPALVFTPPKLANENDDGLLTASEVAALRLNAEWVILSACNTATGDGSEGAPGLSGLARSFFYAGARNLLASHWPVRDEVAPIISVRTVEIFRDNPGISRAESFQRAIREIRNNKTADSDTDTWAHPNAWAPFSLIGDR